ncbi:sensor histidine kinase, partial [Paenibacillus sepulcri]|nr:sensor histidine kinase [Paenibacillus sepulcri]
TNGIRHGRSTCFHFRLTCGGSLIDFALRNNGLDPDGFRYGFGLTALRNQVEFVHGTLALQAAADEGAELRIRLQVPESGQGT